MWRDIFLANREAVLRTLDVFVTTSTRLREAVDTEDGHQVVGRFTRARVAREHFQQNPGPSGLWTPCTTTT
ncbi:prephenate dehydrogenase dimerization domain-containing protein [Pseudomonas aeruginosa]